MSFIFLQLVLALILGGFVLAARGQTVDSSMREVDSSHGKHAHHWNWLSEDDKSRLLHSIPPAPAAGSSADREDLETVLKIQSTRTPAQIAEALADEKFRLEMVSGVLGPEFNQANDPKSFALLQRVDEDESLLNSTLKKINKRNRPYQDHPEVKNLFEVEQYSYPSGHSSGGHTLANILSELFPAKRAALQARAQAVGQSRVVAGVHYPSDVEQGEKLAQALTDALMKNAAFRIDLAAAQAETAHQ